MGQYWPKTAIFQISPKNQSRNIFWTAESRLPAKNYSNAQFSKKMLKTHIFGHFGPKRPILDHFWPKRGHFRIFTEKAKMSLFYSFFSFFNTKNQKILMRGFSGKWARTDGRTDGRTNRGESKGPSTPSRDQK